MAEMMDLIHEAWERVEPVILADAKELERRLARRRLGIFRRAPRAWCLALRATDQRIDKFKCSKTVEGWWEGKKWRRDHEVRLDASELRRLCRPVFLGGMGMPVKDAARLLGMGQMGVRRAMQRGVLEWHREGRGIRGRRIALVWSRKLLDPAHIDRNVEDGGWGTAWRYVADHVPQDLVAVLVRTATEQGRRGNRAGQWRWVCPECQKQVVLIYCPIPGIKLANFVRWTKTGAADDFVEPAMKFACGKCNQVHDFGRSGTEGWNHLVSYLSGGLLYGSEVERPEWWGKSRRRKWMINEKARRSVWRPQVEELLIGTKLTGPQIAAKLGCTRGMVTSCLGRIYKDWNVHTREELRAKTKRMTIGRQSQAGREARVA